MRTITVELEEAACALALGPHRQGLLLRPDARAAIERAPARALGVPSRSVTAPQGEALELIHYFRATAAILTMLGDPRATASARAVDAVRRALESAGLRV